MTPKSHSSSDDEAPEAFSFGSLKKAAKTQEAAIQRHHATENQKKKEKNRRRDGALKERAARTRGNAGEIEALGGSDSGEGTEEGDRHDELEARMQRAMREAEEESDESGGLDSDGIEDEGEEGEEEGDSEGEGVETDDEDEGTVSPGEDREEVSEDNKEGEGGLGDESDEPGSSPTKQPPKKDLGYLPDHIFMAAFSQNETVVFGSAQQSSKRKAKDLPTGKRKRSKKVNQDVVVGSRTIRTPTDAQAALRPTRGVNKFLKRNLNLNGNTKNAKTKGWERRPANIGVMRTSGPAARFVRDS